MTFGALLTLSLLTFQGEKTPENLPVINGYLIVSSDPAFVKATEDTAPIRRYPFKDFTKRFTAPRTRVVPWGDDYAIVFDLDSGVFAYYHDRTLLLDTLIEKLDKDHVLHLSELNSAQTAALGNALVSRPFDPRTLEPIVPTAVGLEISTSIVATAGSVTHTTTSMDLDARGRMMSALSKERQDAAAQARQIGTKPRSLAKPVSPDEIKLTTVTRIHNLVEAMEHTAPLVREIVLDLKEENDKWFAQLMTKLGGGEATMTGTISRGQLSKEQWKAYGDQFANNWHGEFGSEAEARAFFEGSDSIHFVTNLSLMQLFDPGDPSQRRPGTGASGKILSVPGIFGQ